MEQIERISRKEEVMNIQSITWDELYYYEQVYKSGELVIKISTKADKLQVAEVHPEDLRIAVPHRFGFCILKPYLSQRDFDAIRWGMAILKSNYLHLTNPDNNGSKN